MPIQPVTTDLVVLRALARQTGVLTERLCRIAWTLQPDESVMADLRVLSEQVARLASVVQGREASTW